MCFYPRYVDCLPEFIAPLSLKDPCPSPGNLWACRSSESALGSLPRGSSPIPGHPSCQGVLRGREQPQVPLKPRDIKAFRALKICLNTPDLHKPHISSCSFSFSLSVNSQSSQLSKSGPQLWHKCCPPDNLTIPF